MNNIVQSLRRHIRAARAWVLANKAEAVILITIILAGAFFRLYRIGDYMTFLGDEGRDAIIVRRLLTEGDLILIGPGTSIGNMYLGPLYYYLIAPALLLFDFSPVGPSVFVALLGMATIWFIWYFAGKLFPRKGMNIAGLIAAFLYAIAPTVIIYSRSSWNPNVMPFFAILTMFGIWKMWREGAYRWLIVSAVAFAFVLQSHYLGLLLAPTLIIFWLFAFIRARNTKNTGYLIRNTLFSGAIFGILMSPLLLFDARHGWINFNAMKEFFSVRQSTVSARPWNAFPKMWPLTTQMITRLIAGRNEVIGAWTAVSIAGVLLWIAGVARVKLSKKEFSGFVFLVVWLLFSLIGFGLYKQHIYDHYFGIVFPVPFLLIGGMFGHMIERHRIRGAWLALTALVFLSYYNFAENPLRDPPAMQLARTREVAAKIREEARGEKFNLAVIAERNYDDAYQYFLERWNTGYIGIDPLRYEETRADSLYVVCELPAKECDPTHSSQTEIANYGWSIIEDEWDIAGVTLYKLVLR